MTNTASSPGLTSRSVTVELTGASLSYGPKQVLAETSVTVTRRSRLGIVGESGSGKTTLTRLVVGLADPTTGSVTVNGDPWARIRRGDPRRRAVQMIQQDPYAQLTPHLTARSAVAEAARVCRRISRRAANDTAVELLGAVGLSADEMNRRPRHLSGGQCQRIAIARSLAADADVLVADEPTSALDLSVQAQILNIFLDLAQSHDTGLVLVSHDLAVIRHLTEEVLVLYRGEVVERGRTMDVLSAPQHPYTQELCASAGSALIPSVAA
ncbi:MAG: ATP-binding cassette domain-containing protein [Bifidobacteriaceae bacterium]|jgi:peptide/nickel transport system ATP-binding protein|nr:ATP-binding cassette domain-containing protein [Bifidobacteriaceae bacterium]